DELLRLVFVNIHAFEIIGREAWGNFRACAAEAFHSGNRIVEHALLGLVEVDLDHPLDTTGADDDRYTHIDVLEAVLAGQVRCARHDALLLLQVAFSHRDAGSSRRVAGRTGLQQADDLCATIAGALNDLVDLFLRGPAHLDEVRDRNARNSGVAGKWHHRVAMAAENESGDVLDGNLEFFGEEVAEAGRV